MIRKFNECDECRVVEIWLQSGLDEYSYLPDFQSLDFNQALKIFKEEIASNYDVWVEETQSVVRGYLAIKGSYIDRLYVDPKSQKRGVGEALLRYAKCLMPEGLELRTHQQNTRARGFYEKHDFFVTRLGISPPPESVPDVEYQWRPGEA